MQEKFKNRSEEKNSLRRSGKVMVYYVGFAFDFHCIFSFIFCEKFIVGKEVLSLFLLLFVLFFFSTIPCFRPFRHSIEDFLLSFKSHFSIQLRANFSNFFHVLFCKQKKTTKRDRLFFVFTHERIRIIDGVQNNTN